MYTPRNKSINKSKHPIIAEFDRIMENNMTNEKRDELILNLYENNLDFVDNIEDAKTNITIAKLIFFKIVYIRILDDKGEYKRGKPIANQLSILINRLDKDYYEYDSLYIGASKWIAVNLGRTGKYRASNQIFKELIKKDKYKEFYQSWISYNTEKIINYFFYPFLVFSFLWAFKDKLFGIYITVPKSISLFIIIFSVLAVIHIFFSRKIIDYLIDKIYK